MNRALGVVLVALAACGDPTEGDAIDAIDGDPGCTPETAPTAEPPWLAGFLSDQVTALAATPRATNAQRTAARDYLRGQLQQLGYAPATYTYATGANVGGVLAASYETDRWIITGAHFDSVTGSPGANDNATGVAVILAAARALSEQPCRGANVAFTFFDQEEGGLIGSGVYAASLRADNLDVIAVHTIDQAGWDADNDLRFEIERPAAGMFARYQEAAAAVGAQVVQTNTGSTDHESFRQQGYAAAGLTEEFVSGDTTPHYHQPSDTAATVDGAYHRVAARLMIYLLAREVGATAP